MDKSVSLDQLTSENVDNDDNLVNEILNEINANNEQHLEMSVEEQAPAPAPAPAPAGAPSPSPSPEPDDDEEAVQEQINDSQESFENQESDLQENLKCNSGCDVILNFIKKPLVFSLLVVVLSLPIVTSNITRVLPTTGFMATNQTLLVSVLKFIFSLIVFMSLEQVM